MSHVGPGPRSRTGEGSGIAFAPDPGAPPRPVPAAGHGRGRPGRVGARERADRFGQDAGGRLRRGPGPRAGGKAFYTTPIKALSNQKFAELAGRYGADRVGLLTGDVSHQARAPIVVMTTEVLRNMLFARSPLLDGLGVVVLDEVHYLQDPYRGSVWEEVLVLTPPGVAFVSLSATVSNAARLRAVAHARVRGPTRVVVETHRPVTLHHHYAVAERGRDGVTVLPLLRDGLPPIPTGSGWTTGAAAPPPALAGCPGGPRWSSTSRRPGCCRPSPSSSRGPPATTPPASACRTGCGSPPTRSGPGSGTWWRTRWTRLGDDDLRTLGYGPWSAALEAGVAPHHAGLVPAFRQAVERCFSEGLLKVVFATETLALGINMPARTVVVERFAKFRGSDTSALTSGEYQQLTGRAGRRGIDTVGHAFVLWHQATTFGLVARTAVAPAPGPGLVLPPDLQPGRQPGPPLDPGGGPRPPRVLLRPVAGPGRVGVPRRPSWTGAWPPGATGDSSTAGGSPTTGWLLAGIYHESDLLVAEVLRAGLLDGLEPAHLAGVASALTFEARRAGDEPPAPRQAG